MCGSDARQISRVFVNGLHLVWRLGVKRRLKAGIQGGIYMFDLNIGLAL